MSITSKYEGRCRKCGGVYHAGDKIEWTRGEGATHSGPCPTTEPTRTNKTITVGLGVYRKDGKIFVVKPNQDKTRVYAKEIIPSAPRMTEAGEVVDFETVYRPGAVYDLTEADRWDLKEARAFLTKYARCIVCGAHLKAAKSVAGAIGPVCAKYFANHTHTEPEENLTEQMEEALAIA